MEDHGILMTESPHILVQNRGDQDDSPQAEVLFSPETISLKNKQTGQDQVIIHNFNHQKQEVATGDTDAAPTPAVVFSPEMKQMLLDKKIALGEQILDLMGKKGRYQYLLLVLSVLIIISTGFVVMIVSYLAAEPSFECIDNSNTYKSCLEAEACSQIREGKPAKIILSEDSWTHKYQMYCDKADERSSAIIILLLINGVIPFPVLYFIDVYGRKVGLYSTFVWCIVGASMCYFVDSYIGKMVGLGIWNATAFTYADLFTIITTECTSNASRFRGLTIGMQFVGYGFGCFLLNVLAFASLKIDFLLAVTFFSMGPLGFAALFLIETPIYLLDKGNLNEFEKNARKIGKFNGKEESAIQSPIYQAVKEELVSVLSKCEQLKERRENRNCLNKYPIMIILLSRRHLPKTLKLLVVAFNFYCILYGLSVNLTGMGIDDIRINGIIFGLAQTLGYLIVFPFVQRMRRKLMVIIFNSIMLTGTIILLITSLTLSINDLRVQIFQSIVASLFLGAPVSGSLTLYFVHVSESFPPELRGSGNTLVLTLANIFCLLAPSMGKVASDLNIHFAVGCSALGVVAVPLSFFLTETLKK